MLCTQFMQQWFTPSDSAMEEALLDIPVLHWCRSTGIHGTRGDSLAAGRGDPAVNARHTTNGRWDIMAELRADRLESFDSVLSRIHLLEGIANTETSLLLSIRKL